MMARYGMATTPARKLPMLSWYTQRQAVSLSAGMFIFLSKSQSPSVSLSSSMAAARMRNMVRFTLKT